MNKILHLRAVYLQEILVLHGVDFHSVEAELESYHLELFPWKTKHPIDECCGFMA